MDDVRVEVWGDIPGHGAGLLGMVTLPEKVSGSIRVNAISDLDVTVASDDPITDALVRPDAWLEVYVRGARVFTGPVEETRTIGPYGSVEVRCSSHLRALWRCIVEPGKKVGAATAGGAETYRRDAEYWTLTGPAETVLKRYAAAATGSTLKVRPDRGRGKTITASMRMHELGHDRFLPLVTGAGLVVTISPGNPAVGEDPADRWLDVVEAVRHPVPVTDGSGAIASWTLVEKRPRGSGVILGGQGEAVDRAFARATSTTSVAPDDRGVSFKDSRSTADATDMAGEATAEANLLAATQRSLSATLAENETLRYLDTYDVGDVLTFELMAGTVTVTEQVAEVEIDWTVADGLVCIPHVGERTDDSSEELARVFAGMNRRLGGLERR